MKKSIIYILFALFSFSAAVSLTACKDDGVEISDAYKSKTPKNVKLLEYGNKSLTICWDFVRGATSYTVQARGRRHEPRQRSALHDHRRHRLP